MVDGFNEKYVTTTIETRSVKDYPFPAVTFLPGDFNSQDAFKKDFLNQFHFARYGNNDVLRDNEHFLNL